jgi:hypothetical protein
LRMLRKARKLRTAKMIICRAVDFTARDISPVIIAAAPRLRKKKAGSKISIIMQMIPIIIQICQADIIIKQPPCFAD